MYSFPMKISQLININLNNCFYCDKKIHFLNSIFIKSYKETIRACFHCEFCNENTYVYSYKENSHNEWRIDFSCNDLLLCFAIYKTSATINDISVGFCKKELTDDWYQTNWMRNIDIKYFLCHDKEKLFNKLKNYLTFS